MLKNKKPIPEPKRKSSGKLKCKPKKATVKKNKPFNKPSKYNTWQKLLNEIWHQIRLNRTSGPTTILSTPLMHIDVNKGRFEKKYNLVLQCHSSPYSNQPLTFIAGVYKIRAKKPFIEINHIDGVIRGEEYVIDLLKEFNDTGFDPFGRDAL